MYRLATSILYDEDESKDVVSEVFARLMASDVMLHPDTAEAYLLTGVRNQCRNVMERKQVRERFLRLLSEEATEPTITNSEQLRMTELMQYVEEHLPPLSQQIFRLMTELMQYVEEHLPPLSQQIFRLRFLREMTCQEVADTLGISRQTVHSHLGQLVERIREYFKSNT